MCFGVCNVTMRVAVVIKMLVQAWAKIVSFAQFIMLGLLFDFITNSVDSSLTLSSLVDTNCLSIAVQSTWSVRFGLCSICHDIVQR